ncbi:TetR/AcrR family transcriptional regulator [Rhizobium sp. YJ-22]|uniref:TetR/AcrR family transcriptional regulator n=1 Tax=Rhizobium sp. YJ-22 TaxID=3037556 RepID=UPI0024122AFB|nr:TetR/AcrR family transcriptional regulator [Rhizobium sp. YJ-22]MDG3579067.1 TetR/AcrR family transcriptional regulator [Rhizobium sp. YJ-22]
MRSVKSDLPVELPEPEAKPPRAVDRILGTARALFYRHGIRAIGVDEIVRQAGVTKPSLYRSFSSKDELAATYLRNYEKEFWARIEQTEADHPGDARAQIIAYFTGLGERSQNSMHRGCGLSNAAVEYPERDHPARLVSEEHKRAFRRWLHAKAAEMGAENSDSLGDGLLLLFEGAHLSGQLFSGDGPSAALADTVQRLVESHRPKG